MSRLDIFKAAGLEKKLVEAPVTPPSEVLEDKNALTKKDIQDALPAQLKVKVSDELVSKVNSIAMDPMIAEEIRNNFIGFHHVLKDGKFKIEQYLEACAYVTYKMMGYTNQDAYALTFPDRYREMRSAGKDDKHISSFVAAYNKNKLVNIILEQSIIPACILNQDLYQQALNRQAYLMVHATSEKVQTDAANSILNALARPVTNKLEIDMVVKDNSGIAELKNALIQVAAQQADLIKAGESTKSIAHSQLFDKDGEHVA
jgi:hypothetical protein